jgi:hypothetical protein
MNTSGGDFLPLLPTPNHDLLPKTQMRGYNRMANRAIIMRLSDKKAPHGSNALYRRNCCGSRNAHHL